MAALGLAVVQCHAAHVRLEDFNDLSPGPIHGQRNWVDSAGNGRVVSDPADPANQVLALTNTSARGRCRPAGSTARVWSFPSRGRGGFQPN